MPKEPQQRTQAKPTLLMRWSLVGVVVNRGLSVISLVLLARIVGAESLGVWAFATTISALVASISNIGMHLDAQRSVNGRLVSPDGRRRVWIVLMAIGVAGTSIGLLAGLATSRFEVATAVPPHIWVATIALIGLGLSANNFAHRLLIARERVALAFIATDGLRHTAFILIVYFMSVNIPQLLWVYGAACAGTAMVAWLLLLMLEPTVILGPKSKLPVMEAVRSGTSVLSVSIVFSLRRQGDVLLLGAMLTDVQYAIYFAAARVAQMVAMGMASLADPLGPRIGSQYIDGNISDAQDTISTVTKRSAALTVTMVGVLLLTGSWVLQLFGPEFSAGYWVLAFLSTGLLMQALLGPTGMILQFCGHAWRCASIEGLLAVLGLPLLWAATIVAGINATAAVAGGIMILCAAFEARAIFKLTSLRSWLPIPSR